MLKPRIKSTAKYALSVASVMAVSAFLIGAIRILSNSQSRSHLSLSLLRMLEFALGFGLVWFVLLWIYSFVVFTLRAPVDNILERSPSAEDLAPSPLAGFVAMEYYCLILNRTFLVFSTEEGIYGWKVCGSVSNTDRSYFQPYASLLEDAEFMRDLRAIQDLSRQRGGFFIPRSEIVSMELNDKQKWGMGGIPHSGRVNVQLSSGKEREFILLGSVTSSSVLEASLALQSPR